MTVLIADDDRVHVQLVSTRLKANGFKVVAAFDAMQVQMIAMRTQPDVIILDINMPGGTGLDVLKRLKSSTKMGLTPVIVLSGSVDPQSEQMVKGLGAEEFLRKPADMGVILQTVCKILGVSLPPAAKDTP